MKSHFDCEIYFISHFPSMNCCSCEVDEGESTIGEVLDVAFNQNACTYV
jgi:hypothetical protein